MGGNVGIGITDPGDRLHVTNGVGTNSNILLGSGNTGWNQPGIGNISCPSSSVISDQDIANQFVNGVHLYLQSGAVTHSTWNGWSQSGSILIRAKELRSIGNQGNATVGHEVGGDVYIDSGPIVCRTDLGPGPYRRPGDIYLRTGNRYNVSSREAALGQPVDYTTRIRIDGNSGDTVIYRNLFIGDGTNDSTRIRIGGGNAFGYIYGAYENYGDGIHMGYNWARSNGGGLFTNGHHTSRISCGYGYVFIGTAYNAETTNGVVITGGATSWSSSSDIRKKKNVKSLEYGLSEILSCKPVRFDYTSDQSESSSRIGFIAQEVKDVIKEAVSGTEDTEYRLATTEFIPVLVNAIKEQQQQIQDLSTKLARLESLLIR
jgi:hypothetical protein